MGNKQIVFYCKITSLRNTWQFQKRFIQI